MMRISAERQVPLPVVYRDVRLDCGYRVALLVEGTVTLASGGVERVLTDR